MGEGWSNAPANERTIAVSKTDDPDAANARREFTGPHGFDAWLRAMKSHGSSVNFGSFVGSATVRAYVKGMDQGSPSGSELDTMRRLVREAMEDGAFGLASALIYPPDNFVGKEDLIELAKVMAPYGGVYISHIRSEADHLLEAIDEAIEIGRIGWRSRRDLPPESRRPAELAQGRGCHRAHRRGPCAGPRRRRRHVPVRGGSTGLAAVLPPFASAGDKLFDRLADPAERAKIRAEVLDQKTDWENMGALATPENILILGLDKPENQQVRRQASRRDRRGRRQALARRRHGPDRLGAQENRHGLLHDERRQRQAPVAPALDQVRHRRRRGSTPSIRAAWPIPGRTAPFRASWASTCATRR